MAEELKNESEDVVAEVAENKVDSVEETKIVAEEVSVVEEVKTEEVVEAKPKKAPRKSKAAGVIGSDEVAKDEEESESLDTLLDKLIAEEQSKGNIIGSIEADKKDAVPLDIEASKVAVYSNKNASWSGYGSVYKGYNILSKKNAEKWLTRSHVRLATPAEVAQHLR